MPRQSLSELFDELNRKLFSGRLPKCRVVFSTSIWPLRGQCLEERRLIRLLPPCGTTAVDMLALRQTLLHEMSHIGVPGHGRRFQRQLLRLAAQGEAWAALEAEQYKNTPWNKEMSALRGRLDDWAVEHQRIGFRQLVRAIANDFGMSRDEVLRRIPWLKGAWRKACEEADRPVPSRRVG